MKNLGKNKIDVVVKYFYPVAAGIEVNVMETYSILAKRGWDITIHTSNYDYTTNSVLKKRETLRGLKIVRYPLRGRFFYPELNYDTSGLICLHNFDIFPHLSIMIKTLTRKLIGKKNFKLVLTPHGGFNPEWKVFSKAEAIIKSVYHFTLGTLLINLTVDAVRAVSSWEKVEMVKKLVNKNKVYVIANGLENDAFDNIEEKASKEVKDKVKELGDYLIQIGRIYPIKNIETAIKAIGNTKTKINFVHVGPYADQKYFDALIDLAKKLNIEKQIHFIGVYRGIDKYYLIKHAKAMLHTAIWESYCNVVHEAKSQGTTIIAANNTALKTLIENEKTGYLIDTLAFEKFAERIDYILNPQNEKEIETMSLLNINNSREETWAKTAEKMDKLYSFLLSSNEKLNL